MALTTAAAATAATVLGAMYLDAKLLIWNDVTSGAITRVSGMAEKFIEERLKQDRMLIYHNLEEHARHPVTGKSVFLIFEGRSWTYREFYEDVQRVGNWLIADVGVEKGEVVALDGTNSPEYLMMWFGLEAIGAAPAFINCNLTAAPLVHSVKVCGTRFVLADDDVRKLVAPSEEEMRKSGVSVVYYDPAFVKSLSNTTELPESRRSGIQPYEVGSLIYTSGTTGMPKATKLYRAKELNLGRGVSMYLDLKPGVKMYTCLPMYHGAAHGLCVTPCIFAGATVVLSRKFSHKTFWPEVRESKADIIQYVGELCRYLVNAPPNPLDKQHNATMAWGNGMRPDVWEVFRQRFNVPIINELYAATDGLGGTFNYNKGDFGKFAIAKRGLLWHLLNGKIEKRIRIDVVTQEIIRDRNGFAIECKTGEPGEVVHWMDPAMEKLQFAGYYNNDEATEKRKIRDLFKPGDLWFRSGDMMRQEADGCLYFVDRLGDTYRWKSENVSTNEVGDVLGAFEQIAEANVYGVQVPFADGRCGCAAIVMAEGVNEQQFEFDKLARHAISTLPRYAVPIFIRVVKELQYTGTMKVQKGKLREEGVDMAKVSADTSLKDSMYWMLPGSSTYVPYKQSEWEQLKGGKVKL